MIALNEISEDLAVVGLAALGNQTRLRLYKILVNAGKTGLNISDLQALLDIPASTLSHHVARLTNAQLIVQSRQGREVICTANYEMMHGIARYLTDQCCSGIRLLAVGE